MSGHDASAKIGAPQCSLASAHVTRSKPAHVVNLPDITEMMSFASASRAVQIQVSPAPSGALPGSTHFSSSALFSAARVHASTAQLSARNTEATERSRSSGARRAKAKLHAAVVGTVV